MDDMQREMRDDDWYARRHALSKQHRTDPAPPDVKRGGSFKRSLQDRLGFGRSGAAPQKKSKPTRRGKPSKGGSFRPQYRGGYS